MMPCQSPRPAASAPWCREGNGVTNILPQLRTTRGSTTPGAVGRGAWGGGGSVGSRPGRGASRYTATRGQLVAARPPRVPDGQAHVGRAKCPATWMKKDPDKDCPSELCNVGWYGGSHWISDGNSIAASATLRLFTVCLLSPLECRSLLGNA